MFELEKTDEINRLILLTKSNSGVSGPELAKAHLELGYALGMRLGRFDPQDTTVVAILRGGIFFAEGLYFALGCKFHLYDPNGNEFIRPKTKHVILADSVINTGNTILRILEPDMYVACCVINEKAVAKFDRQLFAVRVSKNSFVGAPITKQQGGIGPDTTMRLFNLV